MPKPLLLIIYAAVAIMVALAAFNYILPILIPFIIAMIFSFIMEPIIIVFQRRTRMSRSLATLTAMLFVFGGIAVILAAIILQLVAELSHLSVSLPGVAVELRSFYHDMFQRITAFYVTLPPEVLPSLEQSINNLTVSLQGLIARAVNTIMLFISLVPGTLTILLVSLLATYFLARDRQAIVRVLLQFIPSPWDEKLVEVTRAITTAFTGYLKAQLILVSITTVLSVTGLFLIGADYALTMGLLIGFFDLIPVLGPATIYIPWLIWTFAAGSTAFGIKLVVLYLLVIVIRQVLETKIVSGNLGLHPLATLVAMYAGLKTLGFPGLVIGPILLIAVQAVIKAGVLPLKVK